MARKAPRVDTLKVLYARSGNECAFPNCDHPIFNDDGLYIANLCHIEAAAAGGPRYNIDQTDEQRNSILNLLFMCHRHHKETDDEIKYPVEVLKNIKNKHEEKFSEAGKTATQNMIRQVLFESTYFWEKLKLKKFELADLKIERDFNLDILGLFKELESHIQTIREYCDIAAESESSRKCLSDLKELFLKIGLDFDLISKIPYYENPFISRNWDIHQIGRPNYFSHLELCVCQLKVKIFEEMIKTDPKNREIRQQLDKARLVFEETYNNSYYVD